MRPALLILILLLAPAAAPAFSAAPSVGSPALGLVYLSPNAELRVLRGIPGAAIVGERLELGRAIAAAAVSPMQDAALAVSAGDGQVCLVRAREGQPVITMIPDAMAMPDRMVFSPAGAAALLYRESSRRLQILSDLSDDARVRDLDITGLNAGIAAMAVADDGVTVLLTAGGEPSTLWVTGRDGPPVPLSLPGGILAFRRGTRDALMATSAGDLYLLENAGARWRLVRNGDGQTRNPAAVEFPAGGASAYVATRDGILAAVDTATGSLSAVDCGCAPNGLHPLSGRAVFQVNTASGGPIWLFDASSDAPRLWFVPADHRRPEPHGRGR